MKKILLSVFLSFLCITIYAQSITPDPGSVCAGLNILFSITAGAGSWSSSNTSIATIDAMTGTATGVSAGTAYITYTLSGSPFTSYTATITVLAAPEPITGPSTVCELSTITLGDITIGGSWSSADAGTASVDASTGVVTGVSASTAAMGVVNIYYTLSDGCFATSTVTVDATPATPSGPNIVCVGNTVILTDVTAGGTWGNSDVFATVDPGSGAVTGVISTGSVIVRYTLADGCSAYEIVSVNPAVAGITGNTPVCVGSTLILGDATTGGSDSWSSSATGIASVDAGTGVVTGSSSGNATITYTESTGCYATTIITVNPLPSPITGDNTVCEGAVIIPLDATGGGTWSSSSPGIATIDAGTGMVTGISAGGSSATATITYTLGTGCFVTELITVNLSPAPTSGPTLVCIGDNITLNDPTPGGTWSNSTGNATVGSTSGVVTGVSAGGDVIVYTLLDGCGVKTPVTVDPAIPDITGNAPICVGLTDALADATTGGTWTSITTSVATISSGGVVTGVSAGTSVVSYSVSAGCYATAIVTIDPSPAPITGPSTVCVGGTIDLGDITPGGTWSSEDAGTASVDATTGAVTGISTTTALAGVVAIYYTLSTGCMASATITVEPLPAPITGLSSVCIGSSIDLSDGTPGGTWTSSSLGIATVLPLTGVVTGVSPGIATITYTLGTTCYVTYTVFVNALPIAIPSSNSPVCTGGILDLYGHPDLMSSYSWSGPSGFISILQNPTSVPHPSLAGTYNYTLTVTDANGCTSLPAITSVVVGSPLTISVSENWPINVSGDNAYTNCGSGVLLNPTGAYESLGGTYTWSPTTALAASTGVSVLATPTVTTVYTVTGHYNGCVGTFSVTVVDPAHCTPCDMFMVDGGSTLRSASSTSCAPAGCGDCSTIQPFHTIAGSVTGTSLTTGSIRNYYVYNSLTITGNATIPNNIYFVEPSNTSTVTPIPRVINIGNGANLEFSHNHFFSCPGYMWNGLLMYTLSTMPTLLIDNSTLIEDAVNGYEFNAGIATIPSGYDETTGDNSIIHTNGAIFNKVNTGIYLLNYNPSSFPAVSNLPFTFKNTVFTTRDFRCYSDGSASSANYYPFTWPTTDRTDPQSLKYPSSAGGYNSFYAFDYLNTYHVVTCNIGVAGAAFVLAGGNTHLVNTSGGSLTSTTTGLTNTYCNYRIGDNDATNPLTNENLIDYFQKGVLSYGNNLTMYNNYMEHLRCSTSQPMGVDFRAGINQLIMSGDTRTGTGNTFLDIPGYAVLARPYDLVAQSVTVSVCSIGLAFGSQQMGTYDIHDNYIYNSGNGSNDYALCVIPTGSSTTITSLNPASIGNANVYNNTLADNCTGCTGGIMNYAIWLQDGITTSIQSAGSSAYCYEWGTTRAYNNTLQNVDHGIYLYNHLQTPVTIDNNSIQLSNYTGTSLHWGIFNISNVGYGSTGTYGIQITNNSIFGYGYNSGSQNKGYISGTDYLVEGSSTMKNLVQCNNIHDLNYAFEFIGTNYVDWFNNVMKQDKIGLELFGGLATIGAQGTGGTIPILSDNYWDPTPIPSGYASWWSTGATAGVYQTETYIASACSSPLWVRNVTTDSKPTNNHTSTGGTAYSTAACSGGGYSLNTVSSEPRLTTTCTGQTCSTCREANGSISSTTADDNEANDYTIAPNPNTGTFNLTQKVAVDGDVNVKVVNCIGSTIYGGTLNFAGGTSQMNLRDIIPGIYIIEISDNKGIIHPYRIQVE